MTDPLVLWSTIVGFVLPPVLAIIMQSRWRPEVKGLVAFVACLVAATGTASLLGQIGDGTALTTSFLLIFAGAIATYRLYWRPTGIAPLIERATDSTPPSANPGPPPLPSDLYRNTWL